MPSVMNGRVDTSAWRVVAQMQFAVSYYQPYRYLDEFLHSSLAAATILAIHLLGVGMLREFSVGYTSRIVDRELKT